MLRILNCAREAVCIIALLFVAAALSPLWIAALVWQRHQWQKQVNATMRGVA